MGGLFNEYMMPFSWGGLFHGEAFFMNGDCWLVAEALAGGGSLSGVFGDIFVEKSAFPQKYYAYLTSYDDGVDSLLCVSKFRLGWH